MVFFLDICPIQKIIKRSISPKDIMAKSWYFDKISLLLTYEDRQWVFFFSETSEKERIISYHQ